MNADIFDIVSSGNAFTNPLTSLSGPSLAHTASGKASTSSLLGVTDPGIQGALAAGGLTTSALNQSTSLFTTAESSVNGLVNYGNRSINEAYSRIGTSVSYKSGLKGIGREPNNCDLINKAFGVVQQLGAEWLSAMESAVSAVTGKLNELWELVQEGAAAGLAKIQALAAEVAQGINAAITTVQQIAQQITDGIAAELAHIESMIKECLNFSFANVLNEWFKDNCAAGVIAKIGTKSLNDALK